MRLDLLGVPSAALPGLWRDDLDSSDGERQRVEDSARRRQPPVRGLLPAGPARGQAARSRVYQRRAIVLVRFGRNMEKWVLPHRHSGYGDTWAQKEPS
jgi:hypothetical protein